MRLSVDDPLAQQVTAAIQAGEVEQLQALLGNNPGLANAVIVTRSPSPAAGERSLLHVATDWPGHFPRVTETIQALIGAGAKITGFVGRHDETPLHWAASCDDVEALDALLDAGCDIEAPGSIIRGGSALQDAVAFGQWNVARRLVERGAKVTEIWQASAMGQMELLQQMAYGAEKADLTGALWTACWGGQRECAEFLLHRGADINWIGWDRKTPLDAAKTGAGSALVDWLKGHGARPADQLAR
jgi:uncharacterized protein